MKFNDPFGTITLLTLIIGFVFGGITTGKIYSYMEAHGKSPNAVWIFVITSVIWFTIMNFTGLLIYTKIKESWYIKKLNQIEQSYLLGQIRGQDAEHAANKLYDGLSDPVKKLRVFIQPRDRLVELIHQPAQI